MTMKRGRNILYVVVAWSVGAVLGCLATAYFCALFQSDATFSRLIADSNQDIAVLKMLDSGREEGAKSLLATMIKANLSALSASYSDLSAAQRKNASALMLDYDSRRYGGDLHNK